MNPVTSVDDYLNQFEGDTKARLLQIRELIVKTVPEVKEGIMYGLIGYKLHGKPLVYFGGFTHHIGFYATPQGHAAFAEDLARYKQGKGSVQFPLSQPLPLELIERMVRYKQDLLAK